MKKLWNWLLYVPRIWEWNYYAWENAVWPQLSFGDEWDEIDQKFQEMCFWWYINYGNQPERPFPQEWKERERLSC